jgi:peptidoglycan-N-acetylglucosamine deacetylase
VASVLSGGARKRPCPPACALADGGWCRGEVWGLRSGDAAKPLRTAQDSGREGRKVKAQKQVALPHRQSASDNESMQHIDRRTMLCAIAAGVLVAISRAPDAGGATIRWKIPLVRVPAPAGVLTRLPGNGNQIALTVDDGASVPVVGAFAQFCHDSGTRLSFFVNGANSSWSVNAPALRPMVDSGQVQMGNHTWSHPYLNRIGLSGVADQIRRNADFLRNTYGKDGTPYFRPPYGVHNAAIDGVAADQGYTTITMWSGDVGDSVPESADSLVAHAAKSFAPQQIVLMHANLPEVTQCYDRLIGLIQSRGLATVTLNDVFV